MKRRNFFSRALGALAGCFGISMLSSPPTLAAIRSQENAEVLEGITPTDRSLLFYNEMPDGSVRFGDFRGGTFGHSMFGEQGATATAAEMNQWALMHDGVLDYDEFLLWKIKHPGESYIGSLDSIREAFYGTRQYMQGNGTREFLGVRS